MIVSQYDEDGERDFGDDEEPEEITCSFCGEEGLYWETLYRVDGTTCRVLFNTNGRRHRCKGVDPKLADDFDVVPE